MKKTSISMLIMLFALVHMSQVHAQSISTAPSFSNNNGSGLVTFNFENTNSYPIEITSVSTVLYTAGSSNFTIYYKTTPVNGLPGTIPTSPNWTAAGTGTINSTLGSASNQTQETVLTGISLVVPAGAIYGIAVGGFLSSSTTGSMAYYTMPGTPANVTFTGGGCNLITGANVSYAATSSTTDATFTPRGFVGTLTFQPQVTIQDNAGVAHLISPTNDSFCSNSFKEVSVSVKNLGANALNSANVNWSVDGVLQAPVTLPSPLPGYMDSAVVVLGNAHVPGTAPVAIKAWTSMPNGVLDSDPNDDTLNTTIVAALQGVDVAVSPGDTTICQGTTIVLDAGTHQGNPIYIWENGSLEQTRSISNAGMYIVKVQTDEGCFDKDTVYVSVYPDPVVNSIALTELPDGSFVFNVIGAQHITSYTWDFGDLTDTSGTGMPGEMSHTYAAPGEYTVTLTLSNACGEIVITKVIKINPLGIDDLAGLRNGINIFPNPAKSKVTISNKTAINIKSITVTNILGQKVAELKAINSTSAELSLAGFANGIYNLSIDTDQGRISKKLEVLK